MGRTKQDRLFDVGEPVRPVSLYARHAWITAREPMFKRTMTGAVAINGMNPAWLEWHWARGLDPTKKRYAIPASLRCEVIERDGGICQLCGGEVGDCDLHIDHIIPVVRGGQNELANLQVTHGSCNLSKGARMPEATC